MRSMVPASSNASEMWKVSEPILENAISQRPKAGWGYIYLITSPSGKMYVGQTRRKVIDRVGAHSIKGRSRAIFSAFLKYGRASMKVEILECCPVERLNDAEADHISRLGTLTPGGYNLSAGGGVGHSISGETRDLIRLARAKQVFTEEAKKKMSLAHLGRRNSLEHNRNISRVLTGRPVSEETRLKMRLSHLGAKHSEETRAKRRIALKAAWVTRRLQKGMHEDKTIESSVPRTMPQVREG